MLRNRSEPTPLQAKWLRSTPLIAVVASVLFCGCSTGDRLQGTSSYLISGSVSGAIQAGVTVTLTQNGTPVSVATTNASGSYTFSVGNGSYTVTPTLSGYNLAPAFAAVPVNGANVTQNFVASSETYAVGGTVISGGAPLYGVNMNLSQSATAIGVTTTAANGTYALPSVLPGTYTLTPSLAGYTFSPPSLSITVSANLNSGNFAGTPIPTAPTGLAVTNYSSSGQVSLSWNSVSTATSYNLYYSSTSGTEKSGGVAVSGIATTSKTVTNLTLGQAYFFVVTAINGGNESPVSNEVSATPSNLIANTTWRFVVLSAGVSAGWQRGTLSVNGAGAVTITTGTGTDSGGTGTINYRDSLGNTTPPTGFLSNLFVDEFGNVEDGATSPTFTGSLGMTNQSMIVMSANLGNTQSLAFLTKHGTKTFANADIDGWGGSAGPRKVIYDQISTGTSPQEWEFAGGAQIGTTPKITYEVSSNNILTSFAAPSGEPRPGSVSCGGIAVGSACSGEAAATQLAIDSQGVVTETQLSGAPQPVFTVNNGFLTDDDTLIVAVGLAIDSSPPTGFPGTGRYVLRVYHVTNVNSSSSKADTTTGVQSDLAGTYSFRKLIVGTTPASAWGSFTVSSTGTTSFSSYKDSEGNATPAGFTFTMLNDAAGLPQPAGCSLSVTNQCVTQLWGTLTNGSDPNLNGKLAYNKDMFIVTTTETTGSLASMSSFTSAVK